jgi:hypothetical protein
VEWDMDMAGRAGGWLFGEREGREGTKEEKKRKDEMGLDWIGLVFCAFGREGPISNRLAAFGRCNTVRPGWGGPRYIYIYIYTTSWPDQSVE